MADNKKPSGLKFSPWWISGAIIFLFVLLDIFNSTGFQDPTKISSSKFDEGKVAEDGGNHYVLHHEKILKLLLCV